MQSKDLYDALATSLGIFLNMASKMAIENAGISEIIIICWKKICIYFYL